jgi:hypothetical protein
MRVRPGVRRRIADLVNEVAVTMAGETLMPTLSSPIHDPEHWRRRAAELRKFRLGHARRKRQTADASEC